MGLFSFYIRKLFLTINKNIISLLSKKVSLSFNCIFNILRNSKKKEKIKYSFLLSCYFFEKIIYKKRNQTYP